MALWNRCPGSNLFISMKLAGPPCSLYSTCMRCLRGGDTAQSLQGACKEHQSHHNAWTGDLRRLTSGGCKGPTDIDQKTEQGVREALKKQRKARGARKLQLDQLLKIRLHQSHGNTCNDVHSRESQAKESRQVYGPSGEVEATDRIDEKSECSSSGSLCSFFLNFV